MPKFVPCTSHSSGPLTHLLLPWFLYQFGENAASVSAPQYNEHRSALVISLCHHHHHLYGGLSRVSSRHATAALLNQPLGHLGGWATPWSAEELLDGQHQRVDIPAHTRTAYKGLLQKRLEDDFCWTVPYVSPTTHLIKGLNKLNCSLNIWIFSRMKMLIYWQRKNTGN